MLKPTVDEGAIEVILGVATAANLGLDRADSGRGGSARSALNSLCAFPMKPFMVEGGNGPVLGAGSGRGKGEWKERAEQGQLDQRAR